MKIEKDQSTRRANTKNIKKIEIKTDRDQAITIKSTIIEIKTINMIEVVLVNRRGSTTGTKTELKTKSKRRKETIRAIKIGKRNNNLITELICITLNIY